MLKNSDYIRSSIDKKTMESWTPIAEQSTQLLLRTELRHTLIHIMELIHSFSHPRLVR
jgi:hypothetical protein